MSRKQWITLGVMVLLAVLPPVFYWSGNAFYLELATRLVILAIAAVSLNLILGYGGMVSFGHAAYVGLGAYAVGIPPITGSMAGWKTSVWPRTSGLVQIPLAVRRHRAVRACHRGGVPAHARRLLHHDHDGVAQMVYYLHRLHRGIWRRRRPL